VSIGKLNGLFYRRRAPTLSPTLHHPEPPPSRASAREAARQAAHGAGSPRRARDVVKAPRPRQGLWTPCPPCRLGDKEREGAPTVPRSSSEAMPRSPLPGHPQAPVAASDTTECLAPRFTHSLQRAVAAPILLSHQHAEQGACQHALAVLERGGRGDGHIQRGRALCQLCGAGSQPWKRCALSE
jgi:hypothetical protein